MTATRAGPASASGRILVVEDSPSARRLLQDVLLRLGAELPDLRLVGSVVEALTVFAQWRPDTVFVDIELGKGDPVRARAAGSNASAHDPKDGVELATLLLARHPALRVIVCTATDPTDPRVARLRAEGRVQFITKPLLASRVADALQILAPGAARGLT
jgi:CheY-like chemotaxis protein